MQKNERVGKKSQLRNKFIIECEIKAKVNTNKNIGEKFHTSAYFK